jgi:hypothetical protein
MKGETSIDEEIEIECFDGTRKTFNSAKLPCAATMAIRGAIVVNRRHNACMMRCAKASNVCAGPSIRRSADPDSCGRRRRHRQSHLTKVTIHAV